MMFLRVKVARGSWPVISQGGLEGTIRFERAHAEANQAEEGN